MRGRPAGVRQGRPHAGARLHLIETLRAAAPWQKLRRNAMPDAPNDLLVRVEDFRLRRHVERAQTTTIFVLDASGSSALNRLAEAKGAIELLLADCYVRRDRVAVIAFRSRSADLLLPPTRSLTRAKRCLAALPGFERQEYHAKLPWLGVFHHELEIETCAGRRNFIVVQQAFFSRLGIAVKCHSVANLMLAKP